ncbi:MAG: type II toxin-antitoxin system mRNA interferase toxin, RelE/StbE family [Xanthomonadaceae bacterium]|nr:type II toxin-antitoxin system mRNA interferase toxin, RelE/StbE family [Rhodospirillaceae bacterium]NIA18064.1 type II toxin-antitoxin system mRNA interferase toxin, RelE/StbE family [Xanthomonadaceae bacterium]
MQIDFSRKFIKMLAKAPVKIQKSFHKRLDIFLIDQFNVILNNHQLVGKYKGFKSINVAGNWRAIFKGFKNDNLIVFYLIGSHSDLYK